ncbi:ankyrin-3-like isoform X22 [Octopus vulgaris]|uniref:Ankyrin-3-like isoform X22 n=1 Tax=Octopus vulgaris TaxID=6645 RepID=A0AA36HHF3_OCTVU|nr:ankyrin-3-like isoform X22 [Octopus vulgaris]
MKLTFHPKIQTQLDFVYQLKSFHSPLLERHEHHRRELEITDEDLQIVRHENPYNIVEQGYQMLLKWFQSCDPAKRTPQTLKEALLETECFVAAECLLSDFS